MKIIRYFFEFLIIKFLFVIFKMIGYERSSNFGKIIGQVVGPKIRNKSLILNNLKKSNIGGDDNERFKIIDEMWGNYGRIFAEYPFIKNFRSNDFKNYIKVEGNEILNDIVTKNKQVVFISGHFNNFELMAQYIEKSGVQLGAIYRPLNNIFLNKTMETIRKNYICKNQIKKGKSGSRKIIKLMNNRHSIALMIDQRVSEGKRINFFGRKAFTTTIPAQIIKKYNLDVIPVYIERYDNVYFNIKFQNPIKFEKNFSIGDITTKLNSVLEKMIIKNPSQWIWSHNRWK